MQLKHLVKHGNSLALIIDKAHLNSANLDENSLFQIVSDSTGVTIQSVQPVDEKSFQKAKEHIFKKHAKLFKSLADK